LEELTGIFRGLSNPDRLRIVYLLAMSEQPLCVCEIVDALDLPQYQVSKHLRTLQRLSLIDSHREGRWAYYSLTQSEWTEGLTGFLNLAITPEAMKPEMIRLRSELSLREGGRCTVKARRTKRKTTQGDDDRKRNGKGQ